MAWIPAEYDLCGFDAGPGFKKYTAVLRHRATGRLRRVHFGDRRYQQYHDRIGLFSHLDHRDPERRRRYLVRHEGDRHVKFTPGWFAATYLW